MANELYPHRGPRLKVKPLDENLAATVEQIQVANLIDSEHIDTNPIKYIPFTRTAPFSSRSNPFATHVPLARFRKLEAQMAILLHHINPLMLSSIAKEEEWIERKNS